MAFKLFDRVQETTTTTGTGDLSLSGAVAGFSTFSSRYSTGDTLYYAAHAVDANGTPIGEWEVGLGTYSAANTLTRTTVMASSNSDAAVSFSSGTKRVFVTMTALQGASVREKLAANRTYYVATTGSDTANTGLAVGSPFLTIQKAINIVADKLDLNGYDLTIQVADGTYTGTVVMRQVIGRDSTGNPRITIQGNSGTPSNVVISVTSNNAISNNVGGTIINVKDMKVSTTTSGNCLNARNAALIQFTNIDFGSCAGNHIDSQTYGNIASTGNYSISGGSATHMFTGTSGTINTANRTITLTGTPAFSTAYVSENLIGVVLCQGCTFTGSATGTRYNISMNSVCYTNGAATTYLPGNAAGTTATGGQYV